MGDIMNSLTIAKFGNGYIKIQDYNKSIHRQGEIFCPFCDPPLEVTGVENKFFRALPYRGGHNCGKKASIYFDADWEGRKLVETVSMDNGEIEVTIDINLLGSMGRPFRETTKPGKPYDNSLGDEEEVHSKYLSYKRIVRDVIRTVTQMKNFIKKNTFDELGKIKFRYKMGNEELNINEVVKLIDELHPNLDNRQRFIIYKVENVKIKNGNIYINAYETNGINLATSFNYPSNTNKTGIKKDDYVIAFGKVSYYEPANRYYINTLSDLNIVKMDKEELDELFRDKKMKKPAIGNRVNLPINLVNAEIGYSFEQSKTQESIVRVEPIFVRNSDTKKVVEHIEKEKPTHSTLDYRKTSVNQDNEFINIIKSVSNKLLRLFRR